MIRFLTAASLTVLMFSLPANGAGEPELTPLDQEAINHQLGEASGGIAPLKCEVETGSRAQVGNCMARVPQELPKVRFRPGDVVFISSSSAQSDMLQVATNSTWTHVGVIVMKGAQPFVLEASARVTLTPLGEFVAKSRARQVSVKRPDPGGCAKCGMFAEESLPAELQKRISEASRAFLGKPYDVRFEWGDDKMYCSELIEKIYNRAFGLKLGRAQTFGEVLGLSSAAKGGEDSIPPLVREAIDKRYGGIRNLDLNAPMVTPVAQHESAMLDTVYECSEKSLVPLAGKGRAAE